MYLAFYVEKKTINLREKPYTGGALSTLEKEAEILDAKLYKTALEKVYRLCK